MNQVLVVEDDHNLCQGVSLALENAETTILQCHNIESARAILKENSVDLVLLDINLPDGSGLELLREMKETASTPVILLTANDTELDIVMGLEHGADDYITKPFSLAILRARVNAQLRRKQEETPSAITIEGYVFNFEKMLFSNHGIAVDLSKTEQKLLRLLVENKGITMTRDTLLARIWGDGMEFVDENTLSVAIKRLRDKLGAAKYIKTVYGIGYLWAVE